VITDPTKAQVRIYDVATRHQRNLLDIIAGWAPTGTWSDGIGYSPIVPSPPAMP
jgi:hypothetical protein